MCVSISRNISVDQVPTFQYFNISIFLFTRYQLFKLRQKAKLAAEETEKQKKNRSLVKVVKKKRIHG